MKFDFLVIGSGIAGLSFALKAARHGTVCIVTKANEDESNTKYAQGGVAVVIDEADSYEKHINDTLTAGDGLCRKEIVELVVKEAPARIEEIISYGTSFDKTEGGSYDLAMEGGHSERRVLHHKDITGLEIERSLLSEIYKNKNITLLTHFFAIDLITQHHLGEEVSKQDQHIHCYGVYVLNTRTSKVEKILSRITMMASGGAGHIYSTTTNPTIATGDGIAMVHRAKGKIRNMEFIQFHPTALYNPGEYPSFLITEAIRGFGGILKNLTGEEFMQQYDQRASLAPRDIVARAIDAEMKRTGDDHVYLDTRHIEKSQLLAHFPNIYAKCLSIGIDMSKDMIPVVPAAHYMCGGIQVDEYGRSAIKSLYACGECASTGLHGANRLASNSLIEALVFAHRSYTDAVSILSAVSFREDIPEWDEFGTTQPNEYILVTHNLRELQRVMTDYVGIVRSDYRLERALSRTSFLFNETEEFYKKTKLSVKLCELRNLISVSQLVIRSAMMRKESRGLHYNTDHPQKDPEQLKDSII